MQVMTVLRGMQGRGELGAAPPALTPAPTCVSRVATFPPQNQKLFSMQSFLAVGVLEFHLGTEVNLRLNYG